MSFVLWETLVYVFDSPLVSCFVEIRSITFCYSQSLAMSPESLVKALVVSIQRLISCCNLVSFLMNLIKWEIASDGILSCFSNVS